MLRKESEVILEGDGPVHQQDESGSGQPTLADPFRKLEYILYRRIDNIMRLLERRLTSLEPDARQPRLAMVADGNADTQTCERTEGATTAFQAMHGDSCSAIRVDPSPKTNSTYFGMKAEPPDLPCSEDDLVEDGAAAPKPCLPSLEMSTTTAADGLLPTGEISTATNTTFNKPLIWLYSTEETNSKEKKLWTIFTSAWYDSSFWKLLATPSCRKVIETKTMYHRMFDPGGFQSRLCACPFLGS